jgi:hypothetical protein
MSYTVDELEAACKQFEQEFFGGQACQNVRNVLVDVIRGGHRIPKPPKHSKRKAQSSSRKKKKPKFEDYVKRNIRKRTYPDFEKKISQANKRARSKSNESVKGGQDTPEQATKTPSSSVPKKTVVSNESASKPLSTGLPTYMELLEQVNGPQKRMEIMMQRIYFQYEFLIPRIFKNGEIRRPLANSLVCLIAWYMVIEDLCESLVAERGVSVLSGGEMTTDLESVLKGIQQISTIIQEYSYLQSCPWPMFRALIQKVFLTYLVIETA